MATIEDLNTAIESLTGSIAAFEEHEAKAHDWVNGNAAGYYETDGPTPQQVLTIPEYMEEIRGKLGVIISKRLWLPYTQYDQNNVVYRDDGTFWLATFPYTSSDSIQTDIDNGWLIPYNSAKIGETDVNDGGFFVISTPIPAGGQLALPAFYRPGTSGLILSVNGAICYERGTSTGDDYQYTEDPADPATGLTDTVTLNFDAAAGDTFGYFIPSTAMKDAVEKAQTAAQTATDQATSAEADAEAAADSAAAALAAQTAAQAAVATLINSRKYINTPAAVWDDPDAPVNPVPFDADAHITTELLFIETPLDAGLAGTAPLGLPDLLSLPVWLRCDVSGNNLTVAQTAWGMTGDLIYRRAGTVDLATSAVTWGAWNSASRLTYETTSVLTRVLGGTTVIPKSSIASGAVLVIGTTLIFGPQGSIGVYMGDVDSATISVVTRSISPISSDEPTNLGRVATKADLPLTATTAQTVFGRSVAIDDYVRVLADEDNAGASVEYYITGIDGDGNITWGNEIIINTSDYQGQTAQSDSGKVLTGGATAGTFGESIAFDAAPTAGSQNLVKSGAIKTAIDAAVSSGGGSGGGGGNTAYNVTDFVVSGSAIAPATAISTPAYIVGAGALEVFIDGTRAGKQQGSYGSYTETGTAGTVSTSIMFSDTLWVGAQIMLRAPKLTQNDAPVDVVGGLIDAHNGDESAHADLFGPAIRKALTSDLIIYVRTDSYGDDGNDGLSSSTAFKSFSRALSFLNSIDQRGFTVSIVLAAVSNLGSVQLNNLGHNGNVIICSDSANFSGFDTLTLVNCKNVTVHDLFCRNRLDFNAANFVSGYNLRLGQGVANFSDRLMYVTNGSIFSFLPGYIQLYGQPAAAFSISNSGIFDVPYRSASNGKSLINFNNISVSESIVAVAAGSVANIFNFYTEISGTATGKRFNVSKNSILDTYGGGPDFFPGTVAGTADSITGGIYA